jgi:deoxycytidylate deaminase
MQGDTMNKAPDNRKKTLVGETTEGAFVFSKHIPDSSLRKLILNEGISQVSLKTNIA